jgi:hypothetical protein
VALNTSESAPHPTDPRWKLIGLTMEINEAADRLREALKADDDSEVERLLDEVGRLWEMRGLWEKAYARLGERPE